MLSLKQSKRMRMRMQMRMKMKLRDEDGAGLVVTGEENGWQREQTRCRVKSDES